MSLADGAPSGGAARSPLDQKEVRPHITDTVIAFDQRALQTIQRLGDHVAGLRLFYGEHSAEHARAAASSLAHSLQAMIRLRGRVSQDGELGLYAVSAIH